MDFMTSDPITALATLRRGAVNIYSDEDLQKKLESSSRSGRPLRVKLGLDPSAPDVHLGHTVVLRKLRQFQDAGHQAVLIIGDFTALIGDPSGKSKTRPVLSPEEVDAHARTYLDQVGAVLDVPRLEIHKNSEWLSPFTFKDVLRLAGKMTVARMLERDDFSERYKGGTPIGVHEFMYPLMQAYDSVAIRADVELGGTDQTFNLLAGRDLMRDDGLEAQVALTMPILVGLDGKMKMSKSLGNTIGVREAPAEMFARVMSLPDALMKEWFVLMTSMPETEVIALLGPDRNPRDAKMRLGREIVSVFHGEAAAKAAVDAWEAKFQRGETPAEVPALPLPGSLLKEGRIWIVRLLVHGGFAASNAEARRLVEQGGVTVDADRVTDPARDLEVRNGMVLTVGKKKRMARIEIVG
ncbi:MAG: tyrosine--tRNA ligase [Planctomycetes bacterium]|nr:tyrosine--tRNA ligase [Planctomycetota bacterium]